MHECAHIMFICGALHLAVSLFFVPFPVSYEKECTQQSTLVWLYDIDNYCDHSLRETGTFEIALALYRAAAEETHHDFH